MGFEGKTVLITGAGKGIGRETARLLAGKGARIVALSRTQADLDSLRDEIDCTAIAVDLADADAARRAALDGMPADCLVNCAGINILEPFVDVTVEAFDMVHAVNTRAAMIVAQEYARARIALGGGGAIVNVSSLSSFIGFDDHASYCASKGAMDAMSRVMANELGKSGIRVNCINPIVTMTELAARAWSDKAKSEPVLNRIPIGRFAETIDIAEVIAFLLSDAAAMMNGLSIPLDGGFLVR
ncbi:MAG: SDR family oxidoreductase [Alphaproteobacteria bacterium]|jgi:L-xylulose reductase|nr:SDR family oxidoreductase [Alphaproteobacteria bacterium]MBU0802842.1 SDR family oxidoreductase [Alphaproteobacteria bacterium]MBU0871639.1 SDR family oxidoreductase [Alphaproteobacteria bacterium]MBU1400306.1 SDR family oxidoreductase [Alphaproteobacteria bacterium]MBU1591426.1 SDR family oxidoreductase [Alphaproteobacteria bacterium]